MKKIIIKNKIVILTILFCVVSPLRVRSHILPSLTHASVPHYNDLSQGKVGMENNGFKKMERQYNGGKISLNFQNIKIRAVLQLLSDFTGLNIIVSDAVKGTVTLHLNNIPWDEALDVLLKSHGLAKRYVGDVMLVGPVNQIVTQEREEKLLEKKMDQLQPLHSQLIWLNYAKAMEIGRLLNTQAYSLLSTRGKVHVDPRTNSVWIKDTEDRLREISDLIHGLDIPLRQVLIEARIVNIDTRYEEELGIRFGTSNHAHEMGLLENSNGSLFGAQSNGSHRLNNRLNVNLPAVNSTVTEVPSLGLALARLGKDFLLDLELSAIEVEGGGELISSPRLMTVNQQEAFIEAGEEIPFQQSTTSGATAVEFKKAVLALRVVPQITPDNKVIMSIKVNQDRRSNEPLVLGTPAIDTQQLETHVLADNGETIVLGGIFKQNNAKFLERVPFFGNLPIIGSFFRGKKKEYKREELLIFITPKIVQPPISVAKG